MNFPVLGIITFTPLVAALIILMLPAQRKNETLGGCASRRHLCLDPIGLGIFLL